MVNRYDPSLTENLTTGEFTAGMSCYVCGDYVEYKEYEEIAYQHAQLKKELERLWEKFC